MATAVVTFTDDDRLAEIIVRAAVCRDFGSFYYAGPDAESPSGGVEAAIGIASPAEPVAAGPPRIDSGP